MPIVPWAATPVHARLPAVRAYVEGERLCDAGQTSEGLRLLKEGLALAWELDLPDWPSWAEVLYDQVTNGCVPQPPPPPLLAADTSSAQPGVAELAQDGGAWWAGEAAVGAIAEALRTRNHVLLDGFLGRTGGLALGGAIEAAWAEGLLQPAMVAQPGNGLQGRLSTKTRSDDVAWVDAAAAPWGALGDLVTQADALVHALLRAAPELSGGGGGGDAPDGGGSSAHGRAVLSRMRPMVSRYGVGAAFARHADNHCRAGEGADCNGRWLCAPIPEP